MHRLIRCFTLIALVTAGCESGLGHMPTPTRPAPSPQSTVGSAATPTGQTIAYADGVAVTSSQLASGLYEAAGSAVLGEFVLDQRIARKIAEAGVTITESDLREERRTMLASMHPDSDQAARLLVQLRQRRGLGDGRFKALLHRNASLRKLVARDVVVTDSALQQAYDRQYGPQYQVRLIVVANASVATSVSRQAQSGADFTQLVLAHSTDESRAQGGLIGPISPADPTWPDAIRKAVVHLQVGQVSPPVALEQGFAIVKVENKTERGGPAFADVKDELAVEVRLQVERIHMERLARTLLDEVDVVILDPALQKAWQDRQR